MFSGTKNNGDAKYTDVVDIPDKATISVPNDASNESRALYLLQSAGLIKLDVSGNELATIKNISSNPKNLDIKEVDAAQTASTLNSVDAAVINNSYAQSANVNYDTTLYTEPIDDNSDQWINVIAAQKDWKKSDKAIKQMKLEKKKKKHQTVSIFLLGKVLKHHQLLNRHHQMNEPKDKNQVCS